MKRIGLGVCILTLSSLLFSLSGSDDPRLILRRGDVNNDGVVNISDVIYLSSWLYTNVNDPPCLNQADADNSGKVDNADISYLYNWLYTGGPAPPAPGPSATECSYDDAPYPGCDENPCP